MDWKKIFFIKINLWIALLALILVALVCGIGGFLYSDYENKIGAPDKWSIGIYTSNDLFNFTGENNPVLTADDITDVKAFFIGDPFLIHENDIFYMFFEVYNIHASQGDIGLATSEDGSDWSYNQIVLDEPFHLSYPLVFKWENEYYMIPETSKTKSVRVYKTNNFPYDWSLVKTLLEGKDFVDNTIFFHNDTWWLFTGIKGDDILSLYYSDDLLGPWTEHPESPIIEGDANIARPGGNVIVDDIIIRYAQDDDPYYGNQVWAFEITVLTKKDYEEEKIGVVLKGFENWNTRGMHHISPIWIDGRWIASVDGW